LFLYIEQRLLQRLRRSLCAHPGRRKESTVNTPTPNHAAATTRKTTTSGKHWLFWHTVIIAGLTLAATRFQPLTFVVAFLVNWVIYLPISYLIVLIVHRCRRK